jgi:hydroxymethylpyrimidine pyrophosphatase-like HAD family hydrolase
MLLTDDPPTYGVVAGRVAQELEQLGAAPKSIVSLLALLGPADTLPEPLRRYESVLLPWREWTIQERLSPESVQRALTNLLVGREVRTDDNGEFRIAAVAEVQRIDAGADSDYASDRGHASAVYRVCFVNESGTVLEHHVDADGLGLGYFADPARLVSAALADYVPQVYGISGGVIYQRRLPANWRADLSATDGLDERVVSYVLDRKRALALDADPTPRVEGYSVWRLVADILGRGLLGDLRSFGYPLTHETSRRLLAVDRPSVTDGSMALRNWFTPPSSGTADALKSGWSGGAICCDAAFDLASAAASSDVEELLRTPDGTEEPFNDTLLRTYRRRTGEEIDGERWLLYQLLANHTLLSELGSDLASAERHCRAGPAAPYEHAHLEEQATRWLATERALALAHQRYIGRVFFDDVAPSSGPLCAFDVDWVLETRWLDFPAITPAAALGLRMLMRHGFRPVIATGRSLGEVRSRCHAFGLAGGVAEFGAVIYEHASGRVLSQVGESEQADLDRLREVLRHLPGVYLDHAYRHGVRAVRFSRTGERRGLQSEAIQMALTAAEVGQSVQVFNGGGQTDFAPTSINKGTGIRALARVLGAANADADRPLAFAIGDDWPDFPILELAQAAFVVPNMSKTLRDELRTWTNVRVVRDPHGAGAFQAVSSFLGHDSGRCYACQPPRLTTRQKLVITSLAGSDGPRRSRVFQAAALGALLLRSRADEPRRSVRISLREPSRRAGSKDRSLVVGGGTTPRRPYLSKKRST